METLLPKKIIRRTVVAAAGLAAVLTALCVATGEDIRNVAYETSNKWIRVDLNGAYDDDNKKLVEKRMQEAGEDTGYIAMTWVQNGATVKARC